MPGFVTVACKTPMGLILELKGRPQVTIKGFSIPYGTVPSYPLVGGYALTPNVDADFFEEWMKVNANLDLVRKHFIFAHAKSSDASAQAREMAAEKSGLEPIDPDKPADGIEKFVGA